MTDDVLAVLPGAAEIIEDYGIFSPRKIRYFRRGIIQFLFLPRFLPDLL